MRVGRLQLTRYGHFTDFNLDFSTGASKLTDLHLIYGANEAGKSTTRSAIVDLLYGMQAQSRYSFIHNYKTMEIGAALEQNGQTLELRRFKTKLTDHTKQPLPKNAIDTHGLNRDDYQSRFSFDEATLKKGGEAILDNNGDLGAALFSATSGISDFTAALSKLLEPADQFYEPGKEKGKTLFIAKSELTEIDQKSKSLDVQASYWEKQERLAEEHKSRYEEFNATAQVRKAQLEELNRQQQALTLAPRYQTLRNSIDSQNTLPNVPSTWLSTARELIKNQILQQAQQQQLEKQGSEIKEQKSHLEVDENLLRHVPSIETLKTERTLADQGSLDLDTLEIEHSNLLEEQARLCRQINIPLPKSIEDEFLTVTQLGDLRAHIAAHTEIKTALEIAEQELTNIRAELEQLPTDEQEEPINTDALASYLSLVQKNAQHIKMEQTSIQITEMQGDLNAMLSRLNPWQGDVKKLLGTATPPRAHLIDVESQIQELTNAISLSETRLQQLNTEIQTLDNNVETITEGNTAISFEESRASRDIAWQQHLDSLDSQAPHSTLQKSAREYGLKQRLLDNTTDAEILDALQQGGDIARKKRHQQLTQKTQLENSSLSSHRDKLAVLKHEIKQTAQSLELSDHTTIDGLISWLDNKEASIELANKIAKVQLTQDASAQTTANENERLKQLILEVDNSASKPLSDMENSAEIIALAQTSLTKIQKSNALIVQNQEKITSLKTRRNFREQEYAGAKSKYDDWCVQWDTLLDNTWTNETDVERVSSLLDVMQDLHSLHPRLLEQQQRIKNLESIQSRFKDKADNLLTALDRSNNQPLNQQLDALFSDTNNAIEIKSSIQQLSRREETLHSEIESLQSSLLPITKQLDGMLNKCALTDVTELESTLEKIEERTAQSEKLYEYEQDILSILRSDTINDALAQLTGLNQHSLSGRIDELEKDVEHDRIRLAELHHEYRKVQDNLDTFNSDATVAQLAQTRQSLILDLEAQAIQTMRARLGKLAIEQGIRQFREQHRSSMLENAKRAFVAITCGSYIDLTTQPAKKSNSEDLVGIKNTGQSTLAIDMSSGTRAQLYLALRIAAYQDYCKTREPLPFVADDIMESFDEQRTEATLKLLNEMAKQGQIIYLTHHRHVLDIAQRTLRENVNVHELPQRQVAKPELA